MIVSHRHRFVFVKTTKTAGTSIEIALSEHCGPDDIVGPLPAKDEAIRRELGFPGPQNLAIPPSRFRPRDWVYAAMRRPVRAYEHAPAVAIRRWIGREAWRDYTTFCVERNPFDKAISRFYWSTRMMDPRPDLNAYLVQESRLRLSNWPIYARGTEVLVDDVVRFERLQEGLDAVCERIGIPPLVLPRAKASHRPERRPYREVLGPEARAAIERACAREIAAFGYSFAAASPD